MKKLFRNQKFVTGILLLFVMVGLVMFIGALKVRSSQNGGNGWGYYMPWGYYAEGYGYWNPSPVGGTHSNGTLIKGTTANVYFLENGDKRLVKSWTSFLCNGFDPNAILTVSDSEVSSYISDSDLLCPSGTLLKGTAASVYVVNEDVYHNYTRRLITSEAVFTAAGYSWSSINTVSDTELGWYTAGTNYDETAVARPNGTLIKTAFSAYVYVLDAGQKRLVSSETAFVTQGFSWSNIRTVTLVELNSYGTGNPVQARKGTLMKTAASPNIYVTDIIGDIFYANTYYRRLISSWSVFVSKGYDINKVYTVSATELNTYTDALPVT